MRRLPMAVAVAGAIGLGAWVGAGSIAPTNRDHVGDGPAHGGRIGQVAAQRFAVGSQQAAASAQVSAAQRSAVSPASGTRVVIVVEENHGYDQIIGSPAAPFINSLAAHGTLLTSYHGIGHPSLPNYLAMLGGDTFGITSDCTSCSVRAPNLVTQLETARVSWKAYLQGMPSRCSTLAAAGAYAKRHNPFLYFADIRGNPSRCAKVVPFGELAADVRAGRLPRFAFVVPDVLHDMHDGSISAADRWAADLYRLLATSSAWRQDTRFVLTFDEDERDGGCCGHGAGGHVVSVIAGPRVRAGARDGADYDHYSLLASLESLFHVGRLRHAADPSTRVIPALR